MMLKQRSLANAGLQMNQMKLLKHLPLLLRSNQFLRDEKAHTRSLCEQNLPSLPKLVFFKRNFYDVLSLINSALIRNQES